jgi:hypothetical protein
MGNDAKITELAPGTLEMLILKQEVADFERVLEAILRVAQPT